MTISVGIGLDNYPFASASEFWQWIDLCDNGGVDSLWQSDQLIGQTPSIECLSMMAALAGGTNRLKFGMNVASMGLRDPVITAKACASIDVLSDGRLLPAFGVGLAPSPDYNATNTQTAGRGRRTSEALEIMSRLWSEKTIGYSGDFFQLNGASICPRPVQQPLPLWVGGSSRAAIVRTAHHGTGWQAGIEEPGEVAQTVAAIKDEVSASGRSIDADHYGAGFAFRFGATHDQTAQDYNQQLRTLVNRPSGQFVITGDGDNMMARLHEYRAAGAHKFILRPVAYNGPDMYRQTKLFIEQLQPRLTELVG